MKKCTRCGVKRSVEEFGIRKASRDGRNSICKPCKRNIDREAYKGVGRKEYIIQKRVEGRRFRREYVWNYLLEHPCVDCGEPDPVVLEFDHLEDKVDNVCQMVLNVVPLDRLANEIAKCEVRCANCHRRITARRGNHYAGLVQW